MVNNSKSTLIEYLSIAPIESSVIHVASAVTHQEKNGKVTVLVIHIAVDPDKAGNGICEIPIYLSGIYYKNPEHMEMLRQFRSGQLFVAIELENLSVFERYNRYGNKEYFGKADGFRTLYMDEAKRRLADIL